MGHNYLNYSKINFYNITSCRNIMLIMTVLIIIILTHKIFEIVLSLHAKQLIIMLIMTVLIIIILTHIII